jgi:hypothetical protein
MEDSAGSGDFEVDTIRCVVWGNGVEWGDEFLENDSERGREIMAAIQRNSIPEFCPELVHMELEFECGRDFLQEPEGN